MSFRFFSFLSMLGCTLLSTGQLTAQVLFEFPDDVPAYSDYKYLNECYVAISRLNNKRSVADTSRWDWNVVNIPFSDSAIDAGRKCMENKSADTVSGKTARFIAEILLQIGWDEHVKTLYDRLLRSTAPEEIPTLKVELMRLYFKARPMRVADMKGLYEQTKADPNADSLAEFIVALGIQLTRGAVQSGDTVLAMSVGRETIDRHAKLSFEARTSTTSNSDFATGALAALALIREVIPVVYRKEMLDSIGTGTDAYVGWLKGASFMALGKSEKAVEYLDGTFKALDKGHGSKLPNVMGHFIFKSSDSVNDNGYQEFLQVDRESWGGAPVPGKVNLVVFLNPFQINKDFGRRAGGCVGKCLEIIPALRRLNEKFPDLELTLVSNTIGFAGGYVPITPEQEADSLAKWSLGFHRLKAVHVIETTEWFRMPGNILDQRRIDYLTVNQQNFQRVWFLVIDQDGRMLHNRAQTWQPRYELEAEDFIGAALRRPAHTGGEGEQSARRNE